MSKLSAIAWIFAAASVVCDNAPAQESPQQSIAAANAVVQRLQQAIVSASALENVEDRYELLLPEVGATHDLSFIGQMSVRRQWRDFSDEQRSDFLDRFESLSVMTYAARFVDVTDESLRMEGAQEIDAGRIQVQTSITRADGSRVPIEYLLQSDTDSDSWRIVNIVADGVSDLALKRAEYRALLNDGGFAGLLEELDDQIEALSE